MTSRSDDRGVSVAVTHVLTISITMLLMMGLLVGAGDMLERHQQQAVESGLRDVGESLTSELSAVDQLAAKTDETNVTSRIALPERVGGDTYTLELVADSGSARLFVNATGTQADANGTRTTVSEPYGFGNQTRVCDGVSNGGTVEVVYDTTAYGGDGCLTIRQG